MKEDGSTLTDRSVSPSSLNAVCLTETTWMEDAGREIQAHIISHGKFDEIYKVMGEEMEESDFFQALSKKTDEETPKMEKKEK